MLHKSVKGFGKVNLPSKIRIGPSTYSLSVEPLSDLLGKCDGDKNYIKIADDLAGAKKASTVIHELLHAIIHEYNIEMSEKMEERVVRAIEAGLFGFARDHKKLFIELIKEMGKE